MIELETTSYAHQEGHLYLWNESFKQGGVRYSRLSLTPSKKIAEEHDKQVLQIEIDQLEVDQ